MKNTEEIDIPRTLAILALAFLIAFLIFKTNIFLIVCLLILVLNVSDNPIARFLALSWHKLAVFMNKWNSRIILFLIFYLMLTPIALVFRVINRKDVNRFHGNNTKPCLSNSGETYSKDFFERPW